ncbi:heat-inducible transcriptional repressor HrcA [Chelatococcus sp. CO-6]|uniref:heat-inducible transcriptional repressor HrcA n=1 Tax=Chelatococcus sp. CO-6 TaxID=1702325 RepID=UPI001FDA39F3|nr:heat-inducible transcriptional repressor HrcA [Chelatococcus sp. CO-6]
MTAMNVTPRGALPPGGSSPGAGAHSGAASGTTAGPVAEGPRPLVELNERSREIFRQIVESYLATGEPVGSRNLSRMLPLQLSPASIRNVMADLEQTGLIYAPHTSAGRLPTELGLRFFVDALLEIGDLTAADRANIESQVRAGTGSASLDGVLAQATTLLSGLSRGAGVVVTTKQNLRLKHIEFVRLDPGRALVVLVAEDGSVENRLLDLPQGLPASALTEATNFLNACIRGRTLGEVREEIDRRREEIARELDALTARLVEAGVAMSVGPAEERQLIVRGQANLLEDLRAAEDLERIRLLFADLETQKDVIDLLSRAEEGEGVRIYIGSENKLFSMSGSSMIAAPFRDGTQHIVGVVGVIGPTRLNYARIVPMVDYTARVVSRLLEGR